MSLEKKKKIKINILTRTGNREKYYNQLKKSVLEQTYVDNIRHIKSNDNPNCKYLDNDIDIIFVEKEKKKNFL